MAESLPSHRKGIHALWSNCLLSLAWRAHQSFIIQCMLYISTRKKTNRFSIDMFILILWHQEVCECIFLQQYEIAGWGWGKWGNRKSHHTSVPAQWQSKCDSFTVSDTMSLFNPICRTLKWQNVILRLWDYSNILCNKPSICWKQMNKNSQSLCIWCLLLRKAHTTATSLAPSCLLGPSLCYCPLETFIWLFHMFTDKLFISFMILYYNLMFSYPSSLLHGEFWGGKNHCRLSHHCIAGT